MSQPTKRVAIGRRRLGANSATLQAYRGLVADEIVDELQELGAALRGIRICHVNSSAGSGGVAELLAREIPLLRALGIHADWHVLRADEAFFTVTKALHNALQGARLHLTDEMAAVYREHMKASADALTGEYDVYVVHDPQPAGICEIRRREGERWIWRCHVDSSTPDPEAWQFLRPLLEAYDGAVFTMKAFVPADLTVGVHEIIAPAIDALSSRNMELPLDICRRAVADFGVDLARPVILQVSRFDPWKDPLGVLQAYRLARRDIPGLQLVLAGILAEDDPEGRRIVEQVENEAGGDPDVFVLTSLGNMEVNVFQRSADVVVQKSLKEGFGLVVSEALWKQKPVVGGRAGGIPMQLPAEYQSFLTDSVEDCAQKVVTLLHDAELRRAFGAAGRQNVREHFLLPRLALDDARLIRRLTG
jgi:trehalose synthase